ncbi:uncharacterized protein LOC130787774 isoform X3 [Actinidia eriantha]|uniref:uncharacterized protein LOC130787774 isoform X3 n=1 Tax=Actinidia eriantha TaxID=165200 RepID=UPI0025873B43|nr:uncharacterized protein LOC130787774 isoform X3 [Actinidia eriantha]
MGRRCNLSLSPVMLLFWFASFSLVNGKTNLTRPSVTPINRDLYHTSDTLMEEIKALVHRHPDKLYMEVIGSQNKGYRVEMTVVTYCRNRKEIDDRSKYRVLLSFGQHGRELITSELALRILSILIGEQFLPNMDPSSLNNTLERFVIKMVPMENLNGRKLVEAGDLCERRNGRGVDLNRNWSVDWGKKEKDYDPYEENPGIAPFSEPETQIMRKLCVSFEPHIWVNVHSGMEALFMPYDHKNTTPHGSPAQRVRLMLENLNRLHCKQRCVVGSGGGSVGYLAHGTATDYMYDIARVPMAFTFEGVLNDWSAAFFAMFNMSTHELDVLHSKISVPSLEKLVSIDDYLNGYLMESSSRYGKKKEVLELGMQEIRTYFRLFLLSSVLLMFMFCSRISKSRRQIVSGMPL